MLKYMNADINIDDLKVTLNPCSIEGKEIKICGDISSAGYFIAAGLVMPNSDITLKNVGLNPTRCGILDVVKDMGGTIDILNKREISGELVGDIRIYSSDLKGVVIEKEIIPRLIDEIPIIAVMATQAEGDTIIRNAKDLRNKESDRISATVNELKKIGADIEELDDGMIIHGKCKLKGNVQLETYNDHRLAMSLYVAGLLCNKEIAINNFEWANISFPEFEQLFTCIYS